MFAEHINWRFQFVLHSHDIFEFLIINQQLLLISQLWAILILASCSSFGFVTAIFVVVDVLVEAKHILIVIYECIEDTMSCVIVTLVLIVQSFGHFLAFDVDVW